mgnify:CR=1 FL=1
MQRDPVIAQRLFGFREDAVVENNRRMRAGGAGLADRGKQRRDEHTLRIADVLVIGCAQALAMIPGTSRSGITMTAALALGLTRTGAARFSFLLSIPTILASSVLISRDLLGAQDAVDWTGLALGVTLSGVAAYLAILYFLRFIERIGMWPFVIYRLLLGASIFMLVY